MSDFAVGDIVKVKTSAWYDYLSTQTEYTVETVDNTCITLEGQPLTRRYKKTNFFIVKKNDKMETFENSTIKSSYVVKTKENGLTYFNSEASMKAFVEKHLLKYPASKAVIFEPTKTVEREVSPLKWEDIG